MTEPRWEWRDERHEWVEPAWVLFNEHGDIIGEARSRAGRWIAYGRDGLAIGGPLLHSDAARNAVARAAGLDPDVIRWQVS